VCIDTVRALAKAVEVSQPKTAPREKRDQLVKGYVKASEKERLRAFLGSPGAESDFVREAVLEKLDRAEATRASRGQAAGVAEPAVPAGASRLTPERIAEIVSTATARAVFEALRAADREK